MGGFWTGVGFKSDQYRKVSENYYYKLMNHTETRLESDMMFLISQQARCINAQESEVITLKNELDKIKKEAVFLLSLIQEEGQGVGDSMISIGGK